VIEEELPGLSNSRAACGELLPLVEHRLQALHREQQALAAAKRSNEAAQETLANQKERLAELQQLNRKSFVLEESEQEQEYEEPCREGKPVDSTHDITSLWLDLEQILQTSASAQEELRKEIQESTTECEALQASQKVAIKQRDRPLPLPTPPLGRIDYV